MAAQGSIWSRVGSLFRSGVSAHGNGNGNGHHSNGRSNTNGVHHEDSSVMQLGAEEVADAPAPRNGFSILRGWRSPLTEKRDAMGRVVELMDAMQHHFERQDARAQQMTQSVERVAGILEHLAETQRNQGDTLRSMASQAETAGRHHAAVAETLQQMPASLMAQAEALRTVARRIELGQESDAHLVGSMQRFGSAVDSLRAAGLAQVETLQNLHTAERAQKDALTALIRDQGRRFLILMVVASVMALGALGAMAYTLAAAIR